MTYYRGSRVPLSERTPRSYSVNMGWKGRKSAGKEKKHFLGVFGPKEKPVVHDEPKFHTFYRPGVTPAEETPSFYKGAKGDGVVQHFRFSLKSGLDTPGYSRKEKAWIPKAPVSGGVKWVFRLAGLVLLTAAVAWSKQKTTALLQDVAGLKLGKVSVEGNHYLTDEEVAKAVALPVGENMFKLDLEQATQRIKKLDWVDRVFIERRLPSSLLVSIRERKPVALLDNGALYGVDGDGRVLNPSGVLLSEDLPLISGVPSAAEAVGTTRMAETLKPALDFFAFLKRHDSVLAADVSEVNLSDHESLKVTFIDGIQATFDPPVSETQLRRMALVLSDLNQKEKRAGTMDFRYRDMVLVKTR